MLGVVFKQQEVFQGAMQRHLVWLDGDLIEPRQIKGGFVNTAVFVGELLFQVVQGSAALRRELVDVVERHTQEAAALRPLGVTAHLRVRKFPHAA